MITEIWKQHPKFSNYAVSDCGRVRNIWTGHVLKPWTTKGYYVVGIHQNKKAQRKYVHHLVLETFIGPRPKGMECRHGPKGKLCNFTSNLSWGTKSDNLGKDKLRDGTLSRGERHGQSRLTANQVMDIRGKLKSGETQEKISEQYGIAQTTVSAIKTRKNWFWL